MALDLRDVEMFLAVDRQGSFGRAATELLVSQPAVSERIRHLERTVGRPVFYRTSRGAVLTAAGEALLPYARRCVALAQETIEATQHAAGTPALVVAVHSTFGQRVVPFVVGTLTAIPQRIAIRDAHSEEVHALVNDGAARVGFALSASTPRGLRRVALRSDPVLCVASPHHPLTRRTKASAVALKDSLIAMNAWGDGITQFVGHLHDAGVDDWRVRYCSDSATAVALARDHNHIAFVTRSAASRDLGNGQLQRIAMAKLTRCAVHLDLLHRISDADDPAVRALTTAIENA